MGDPLDKTIAITVANATNSSVTFMDSMVGDVDVEVPPNGPDRLVEVAKETIATDETVKTLADGLGFAWDDDKKEWADKPDRVVEVAQETLASTPDVCPCQSDDETPGPHIATCPWKDPNYEPTGERLVDVAHEAILIQCCQAKGCEKGPEFSFVWPGSPPTRQCKDHTVMAIRVADVLGFTLVVWPI